MALAAVIVAALALGLAAFAVWLAWTARARAIDAQQRTARHQLEHRTGAEDTGIRRHRAVEEPGTEQLAVQRPDPATALAAATPPSTGPYARLRQSADDEELNLGPRRQRPADTGDLPATAAHASVPRRPGSGPNFTEPPPRPSGPPLPPPGRIDHDR